MDLQELKRILRDQLAHLLELTLDQKDLVIDPDLTKPLDRVAGVAFLKEHGVDKIFKLESFQKSLPGRDKRIYLVRASMVNMKYIADQITAERRQGQIRDYTIIMVPRRLHMCEMILEDEGVYGHVTLEEFHLDLFPVDTDLLSLEMPSIFRSFYLDGDYTHVHTVASSLVKLEQLYGRIPNVYTIGKMSKMTHDVMNIMHDQEEGQQTKFNIGQLYIIDREVDYVTPMCSPMSYEALLDETFSIECGVIELAADVVGKQQNVKMLLSSNDPIYSEICNRHFSSVFPFLSAKAKELQAIYEKKNSLKTVGDMKTFVNQDLGRLKHQQAALSHHISACEHIMKTKTKDDFEAYIRTEHSLLEGTDTRECITYIEDSLYRQAPFHSSLRLLCLLSLTQDGLTPRDYKTLKADFLHSHGFEHLATFFHLKKVGMMVEQEASSKVAAVKLRRSQFKQLSTKLSLIPKSGEDVNLKNPTDISYVFGGAYSPLTVKIVEYILQHDTQQSFDDIGKMIPGGIGADVKYRAAIKGAAKTSYYPATNNSMKTVLVCFLGGCTFSEVAALRMLARRDNLQIIVATTALVTGHSLLDQLCEKKSV
ncbi:vacuolar protein sorting-associated protein 33B-like [Babylonia areolata]|uniref:vacuolar protein sorting-associated protein 33B-like n=1 Tax=Babylonia areolata TaxID=304850 RepID=UPI003FD5C871